MWESHGQLRRYGACQLISRSNEPCQLRHRSILTPSRQGACHLQQHWQESYMLTLSTSC